jgi:hypothetical protein
MCARLNVVSRYVLTAIQIALPFWRRSVDKTILGHREEHKQYIRDRGLFTDAGAVPDPK